MSIIRVGLAETKNFSEGYDLIFGKKKDESAEQPKADDKKEEPKKDEAKKAE